jgi:hypothetical protein
VGVASVLRVQSRVELQVAPQVCTLREPLVAELAKESLLTGVDHQVLFELLFGVERFPAMLAREILLPRVVSQVRVEITAAAETLAASGAHEGSLPVVHHRVLVELLSRGESLGAERTGVGALARVRPHVRGQVSRVDEALVADVAAVGLLPGVDSDVLSQVLAPVEDLPAGVALVDLALFGSLLGVLFGLGALVGTRLGVGFEADVGFFGFVEGQLDGVGVELAEAQVGVLALQFKLPGHVQFGEALLAYRVGQAVALDDLDRSAGHDHIENRFRPVEDVAHFFVVLRLFQAYSTGGVGIGVAVITQLVLRVEFQVFERGHV